MRKNMMIVWIGLFAGLIGTHTFAQQGHESAEKMKMQIPASTDEILAAVGSRTLDLEKTIEAKALAKVHVAAFEIRDLLLALPEKPNSLSAEEKTALTASLKKIKQQAGLLDKYGDAGDLPQTKAVFGKLKEEIEKIKQIPGLKQ